MIEVIFSKEQIETIKNTLSSTDFRPASWSNNELNSIKKTIKDHYLSAQNFTCFYCRQRFVIKHNRAWDTEHIISRSAYPRFMFEPKNLCVVCIECNTEKSDKNILNSNKKITKLPKSSAAYKIVHPHFDTFEDHIEVILPGQFYKHRTLKGRSTMSIYGLDRFLKSAGLQTKSVTPPKIQNLLSAALLAGDDYQIYERLLLEEIILNSPHILGPADSIIAINKIRN
ncbi:HNH endonuclease [Pseudomonas fluorescens]|nr:HNH endonuclease [Pseudomonas fluorescens]